MGSKHTPGPLTACAIHGEGRTLHLVMADGPTEVASCLTHADAVLFAAAPDLLAALEGLLDSQGEMIECNPDEGTRCFMCGGEWSDWRGVCKHTADCPTHAARAAIAKARGHE